VYLHQGGHYDSETGLYDFRNRFYDPDKGRWLNLDPIGFDAGDSNLYRYVYDTPVNAVDPTGLWSWKNAFKGAGAGAAGGAVAGVFFGVVPGAIGGAVGGFIGGGLVNEYVKHVTIKLYYSTSTIVITKGVEQEVNRIFQDCIKRGSSEGSVTLQFIKVTKQEYDGTKFGRRSDQEIAVGFEDTLLLPVPGQTGNWEFNINPNVIKGYSSSLGVSFDQAVATTIAHEAGLHAIGRKSGHFHDTGFVDASTGKVGGVFSDEACRLIIKELNLKPK
jgi:RHS repeat-associated protein